MVSQSPSDTDQTRRSTGIPGLDTLLDGGLISDRSTLLRGPPGSGKTILGLHFLAAGQENDETTLFINFGEPHHYIRDDAAAFGIETTDIHFLDLTPTASDFSADETYDVFAPADVEGPSIADHITTTIEDVQPDRVLIDSMTQLRYLVENPYLFRRQVLALLRLLEDSTVVFTSQATTQTPDDDLQFLSDAVINLNYTDTYRTIQITKLRGAEFEPGTHSLRITNDGLHVAPRLTPPEHNREFPDEQLSTGIPEFDELLAGGLDRGTTTMITGPSGVGKTTTGLQFLTAAAGRGLNTYCYTFEEDRETILKRSDGVNLPVRDMIDQGRLELTEIEPRTHTLDEFNQRIRHAVEADGVDLVMIDAIDGYLNTLLGESGLEELQILGRYLRTQNASLLLINELHHITGEFQASEHGVSQLADNIIFLRHIEHQSELRKVIGVLKQRTSAFERTLRELQITEHGLKVGEPLNGLHGLLTGTPQWAGDTAETETMESHAPK